MTDASTNNIPIIDSSMNPHIYDEYNMYFCPESCNGYSSIVYGYHNGELTDLSCTMISGNPTPTFLNIYTTMEQQVPVNIPIIFDSINAMAGDCNFIPNTADIWVYCPGFYQITTNIYHLEACQFSLYKNDTIVDGTTVGSLSGSSQNNNICIIQIVDEDIIQRNDVSTNIYTSGCKLQLVNNTEYLPYITLIGSSSMGNSKSQITASIVITKLGGT